MREIPQKGEEVTLASAAWMGEAKASSRLSVIWPRLYSGDVCDRRIVEKLGFL